jgi:flagellar basal body-associated protein FliL
MARSDVIASALLAVIMGAGVYVFANRPEPDVAVPEPVPVETGEGYILESLPVLAGSSAKGYMKVTPVVVLNDGVSSNLLGDNLKLVEAATFEVASTFPIETLETTEGLDDLRARLTKAFKEVLGDENVSRVVLNQVIVQPASG